MRVTLAAVCAVLLHALPGPAQGYAYFAQPDSPNGDPLPLRTTGAPIVWPDNRVDVAMTMNFGAVYNDSMETAMQTSWNSVGTRLQFRRGTVLKQDCDNDDGVNIASWATDICGGDDFGDALAVTVVTHIRRNGVWEISDTDIVLDMKRAWVISSNPQPGQYDFRRVIIHELGHALGLEHPDDANQDVVAIMNSRVSDISTLQDDDINGLTRLYGGNGGESGSQSRSDSGGADTTLSLFALLGWWLARRRSRRGHSAADRGGL